VRLIFEALLQLFLRLENRESTNFIGIRIRFVETSLILEKIEDFNKKKSRILGFSKE